MEVGILRRILKRARRWYLFQDEIRLLKETSQIGRAILLEQKALLLSLASQNCDWENAYNAMELAVNSMMRGCEIRGLKWMDIDFFGRTVTIRDLKTNAGRRLIPLNANAMAAILRLKARAEKLGTSDPEHFVFPGCENWRFDGTKAMKGWRTAWRRLTIAAGLKGLRFHDLRHTAITELAESRASEQTIMAIAGHVSREMLEHYSHIRLAAKRAAVEALETKPAQIEPVELKPQTGAIH